MKRVRFVNVEKVVKLPPPIVLEKQFPASPLALKLVLESRKIVKNILSQKDKRFLMIVGPCSIHNETEAMEYAHRLLELKKKIEKSIFVVMRTYFEKPRTTIGWKGLINDPHLNGLCDIREGLTIARKISKRITDLGLPIGSEALGTFSIRYFSDLLSWVSIGARTSESQTHREMASGLSMPVGFKNSTDGSYQSAIDAMQCAKHKHAFVGIDENATLVMIKTKGNPWSHVILRGGRDQINYNGESISEVIKKLKSENLLSSLVIDCSHGNSRKDHKNQEEVLKNILEQRLRGNIKIVGAMLESYLKEGSQKIPDDLSALKKGVSVTDSCLSWEDTERVLLEASKILS
ncbi:MAG: 3-deoxy-7-phosphoheptulonate synthase [Patescibacteria group bacterium]